MEREAFRQRMQQYKQARENNPQLKYWDWKSTVQREPLDGVYEDARFIDQSKPRFELRKGQQYYASPNNLKLMKVLGKTVKVLGPIGEVVQNLFPSEETEILEDARYKYENALKPKVYADGGEVKDNTYVAPVYKEQVFIPATGAQRIKNDFQYKYGSKSPYKGGELEIVSPEFDILTGVRGLKSITNDLLDNYVGRKLPSNYAYRRTVQQELDDIINTNSFREIPENVVTTGGRTITLPNGKTVTLKKAKGNSHGGKAFSAGDVWKGTTSSGNTSSEIIVGVPGDNAKWMVGKHGNYQGPYNFSDIEKGSAIFVPFDTEGVANISTEGLKYFKPSKYFNNRYIKYANGGIIDEDPPQNTSERPITNFDPKGDPYNPTYGYNPGAGYVSNSDPLGSLYVEGALLNPVFKLAGNAVSNVARGLTKYSSKYVPEVRRTVQDKINSLFRREAEDKARTYKLYDDAIESRNRIIEDLYSNPAYMERARQIQNTYGDNYAKVYEDIINQYNTNYWNLPNPVIKQLDAKAKMQAKDAAVNRYITRRQPAGYDDFEYQINRNLTEIDYPTTRHELGHYVDFNLAKSSNPDYSNSMFAELKRDLSKQKNPLFPDKTDYYSKGTEQKSYMNTLREYMVKNGMINNISSMQLKRRQERQLKN